MQKIFKFRVLGFYLAVVFFAASPVRAAMQDDLGGVTPQEVFQAAEQVAKDFGGIHKSKPEKGHIETNWSRDYVRRSRGMFRKILYQRYERRTKLKIDILPTEGGASLKVKGTFQDRPDGQGGNVPWKTVRMDASDHRLEREVFFKILSKIQDQKRSSPISIPVTQKPITPASTPA